MTAPVLHFIDTVGPGGAETVFLQAALHLRNRGWDSHVAVTGPGWVLDRVLDHDLPVTVVPTQRRFDARYALSLYRLVKRHRIELIHAHLFSPAVYASLVGMMSRIPVVATLHGWSDVEPRGWGGRLRYRFIDRHSRVVCVSEPLRAAARTAGLSQEPAIIHNGVDLNRFPSANGDEIRQSHGIATGSLLAGALGNVRPAKDYMTLIRAAAELKSESGLHFAVAGQRTEPLFAELIAVRDELGVSDRFQFWGFCEDVPGFLASLDMLVISSASEGFSLAAVQAMAAGVPVIATRSGGPEQIITDEEDGLLVPVGSASELARAIGRLARDAELRTRLAARGRETVRRRFTLDAMLSSYESLYIQSLEGRSAAGGNVVVHSGNRRSSSRPTR